MLISVCGVADDRRIHSWSAWGSSRGFQNATEGDSWRKGLCNEGQKTPWPTSPSGKEKTSNTARLSQIWRGTELKPWFHHCGVIVLITKVAAWLSRLGAGERERECGGGGERSAALYCSTVDNFCLHLPLLFFNQEATALRRVRRHTCPPHRRSRWGFAFFFFYFFLNSSGGWSSDLKQTLQQRRGEKRSKPLQRFDLILHTSVSTCPFKRLD